MTKEREFHILNVEQACYTLIQMAEQQRPRLRKGADFDFIQKSVLTKKNSEGH